MPSLRDERDALVTWLRDQGLTTHESDTNFVLFGPFPDRDAVWQGLFVQGYGADYSYPVQKVDVTKGMVTTIANATHLCEHNGIIYMVYGDTD